MNNQEGSFYPEENPDYSTEYIGSLLSDTSDLKNYDLPHELITLSDPIIQTARSQAREILRSVIEYKELMMMYKCAIKEVRTKLEILDTEFEIRYKRNPINFIDSRLKTTSSIIEKMKRKNIPFSIRNIEEYINDVAGVRVICSYTDDIYRIADALIQQDDIRLIEKKDYITHPKPNGYRSLHLLISVPVYFAEHKKHVKGGYNLKIKLNISSERYNEIKFALEERGIEIDDTADLVLSEANSFIDNLIVREKGTKARIILPVEDIVYIESFGHAVEVQTLKAVYQATDRLYRIISLLDPEKFLRISNSVIIARNKVKRITPTLSSKFILTMINGKSVDVTRSYYYIFKEYFGI